MLTEEAPVQPQVPLVSLIAGNVMLIGEQVLPACDVFVGLAPPHTASPIWKPRTPLEGVRH
jgi:hypothetical protein